MQYIFRNSLLSCEFCRLYKLTSYMKILNLKTQTFISSFILISIYDNSISIKNAITLHYFYSNDMKILCESIKFNILTHILTHIYNSLMKYFELHNMIITLLLSKTDYRISNYSSSFK